MIGRLKEKNQSINKYYNIVVAIENEKVNEISWTLKEYKKEGHFKNKP